MLQISLNKDYHIKNVVGFISPSLVFQSGEINNLYNIYIPLYKAELSVYVCV